MRVLDRASPFAGPVITHTAMNFLPTSLPAQRSMTAAIMSRIPSAVESATRAYAEIFLLGPAHHSGIPARESSQFRKRAHISNHSDAECAQAEDIVIHFATL